LGSSESRPATAQPPEPPPTTTKSNVSVTRVPPDLDFLGAKLGFCAVSGKSGSPIAFRPNRDAKQMAFGVTKTSKTGL
jgi:hypothetical protein